MSPQAGTVIAFACVPGTIAIEREGERNSLFTKHLLQHIATPNKDLQMILHDVTKAVIDDSHSKQIPFLSIPFLEKMIYLSSKAQGLEIKDPPSTSVNIAKKPMTRTTPDKTHGNQSRSVTSKMSTERNDTTSEAIYELQQNHPACQFRSEKPWLGLQYHQNGTKLIRQPHELTENMQDPPKDINDDILNRIQGSIVGMALGDALGAHVEFRPREFLLKYPVVDLEGGGTWGLTKGQFTDDTSMAICLAASLGALAAVNLGDDTDTTAAIFGQLAGAYYGYRKLPGKWIQHVYAKHFLLGLSKWIAYEGEMWQPSKPFLSTTSPSPVPSQQNTVIIPCDQQESDASKIPLSQEISNVSSQQTLPRETQREGPSNGPGQHAAIPWSPTWGHAQIPRVTGSTRQYENAKNDLQKQSRTNTSTKANSTLGINSLVVQPSVLMKGDKGPNTKPPSMISIKKNIGSQKKT
ncbi:unnamed protein product [Rotaria sordida]|uniref:ADP-ribosylhydrolase ARH3 n=1 Tax=Rotaria sordida TaxID=392033 RepID=A0A814N251_9BILA|nr:unnamed protein product [Rotaria sordida]